MRKPHNPRGSNLTWLRAVVADPPDGCALWPGGKGCAGRGEIRIGGVRWIAPRLAYELAFGPIPDGLYVLHGKDQRCVSPACCNPRHLYTGTPRQNQEDRKRDGTMLSGDNHPNRLRPNRLAHGANHWMHLHPEKISPARGEAVGASKLTDVAVCEIRRRYANHELQRVLAMEFGVSGGTISRVVTRKQWAHVSPGASDV